MKIKKLLRNQYVIILIIATIVFIVRLFVFYKDFPMYILVGLYPLSILVLLGMWEYLKFVHNLLDKKISYGAGSQMFVRICLEVCLGLVIGFLFVHFVFLMNVKFLHFVEFDKKIQVSAHLTVFLMILLLNAGFVGNYYFNEWKKALFKAEKLEKEKALIQKERANLQFTNLQNQLNPHFLFNSITSLNSLIHENQALASEFLQQLAKVYRYVLQNKDKELVSLQTELDFIENYLFLLKTRFGNGFATEICIAEKDKDKQIVPVTLQVLIENAIKHNIMTDEKPMKIRIFTQDDYLCVENNLQKKNIVENSNGIGLENMKTLYSYLSDKTLQIIESKKSFLVNVPLI